MLENIKVGDRIINRLGEEAVIVMIRYSIRGLVKLTFNRAITGWIKERPKRSWYYTEEGKFVRNLTDNYGSDITKVIKDV